MFTLLFKLGLRSAELKLTFLVGFIAFLIALFAVELSPILLSFDLGLGILIEIISLSILFISF